jgi:hypothetical protein
MSDGLEQACHNGAWRYIAISAGAIFCTLEGRSVSDEGSSLLGRGMSAAPI